SKKTLRRNRPPLQRPPGRLHPSDKIRPPKRRRRNAVGNRIHRQRRTNQIQETQKAPPQRHNPGRNPTPSPRRRRLIPPLKTSIERHEASNFVPSLFVYGCSAR